MAFNHRWESLRPDNFELYIVQKQSLEDTRRIIKQTHGFSAGTTKWTKMLRAWKYGKNNTELDMQILRAKGRKRKRDGKDTVYLRHGVKISEKLMWRSERRTARELISDAATPDGYTYRTPSPQIQVDTHDVTRSPSVSSKVPFQNAWRLCDEGGVFSTLSSASMVFAVHAADINMGFTSAGSSANLNTDSSEVSTTMLDYFLSDKHDPWSPLNLSHQLEAQETVLPQRQRMFLRINELFDLSCEEASTPHSCVRGRQPGWAFYEEDRDHGDTPEMALLEDSFEDAVALTQLQYRRERLSPLALRQEFELAKAVGRFGHYVEAEYHCRKILSLQPTQIDVQAHLGMILATVSRIDEATFFLFAAFADFIIEFRNSSIQGNAELFEQIDSLLDTLMERIDQDWSPVSSCVQSLVATIAQAASDGTIEQIFPQLLLHGFSLAHQCLILELRKPGKHMYEVLLEEANIHLSAASYGNMKAEAHRSLSFLLRDDRKWKLSAEQLICACKAADAAEKLDKPLCMRLRADCAVLVRHLASQPDQKATLTELIEKLVKRNQATVRNMPHGLASSGRASFVEEYFLSDLPNRLAIPQNVASPCAAGVEGSSVASESARTEEEGPSSEALSSSVSNRFGVSYTNTSITGISISGYFTP